MGAAGRSGFTLVEVLVLLAVLGISLLVVSLTLPAVFGRDDPERWSERLLEGQRRAVETGRPVVVQPDSAHRRAPVLFLPDGRAVGPDADPLTGRTEEAS